MLNLIDNYQVNSLDYGGCCNLLPSRQPWMNPASMIMIRATSKMEKMLNFMSTDFGDRQLGFTSRSSVSIDQLVKSSDLYRIVHGLSYLFTPAHFKRHR